MQEQGIRGVTVSAVKLSALTATIAILAVFASGSASASDTGLSLRGFGTATIDGDLAPGEWNAAGKYDFMARRAPDEGGGTVPATLYVMNDATNIYLGLRVSVTNFGYSPFDAIFHAPGPNPFGEGSDILRTLPTYFEDVHYHQTSPFEWSWLADVVDGGTRDGTSATQTHFGFIVYEVAHPLDSPDNRHDFSLAIPKHVTFVGSFQHCFNSCVGTFMPSSGFGEIVVVSGTHVPPNTRITAGPPNGAEVRDERTFEFTGTDDVAPADELRYECMVDGADWSDCESPVGGVVADGWHTLRVRALDDMLNADPSPTQRRWRIDSRPPSRPSVTLRNGVYRFSSKDRGTPARRIAFRCGVDTKRLHACGSRLRLKIRSGRHVLRVRAVDPASNQSGTTTVRLRLG
jgi:hypothetical protein